MDYTLHQRGRASLDFLLDMGGAAAARQGALIATVAKAAGPDLPRDPDGVERLLAPPLAGNPAFRTTALAREWQRVQHGRLAKDAFEEFRTTIEPRLQVLQSGPTTLTLDPSLQPPAYWSDVTFHRTEGSWDGHEHMGFVHGELVHRYLVSKTFGGDIYAQRREAIDALPRQDYRRMLELGCSSAPFTRKLAEAFPNAELSACDISRRQLEQAQRVGNELGKSWRLFQAMAEETGCPDDSFDLVASYALFHEVPRTVARRIMAESFRVLAPGGDLLMADVTPYHDLPPLAAWKLDNDAKYGEDPFWREYATTDFRHMAETCGFVDVRWFGLGGPRKFPYVLIARKPAR